MLGTVHLLWLSVEVARSMWSKTLVASSAQWSACKSSVASSPSPARPLTFMQLAHHEVLSTPGLQLGLSLILGFHFPTLQNMVEGMCVPRADTRSNDG